jgi:hypothetical protein
MHLARTLSITMLLVAVSPACASSPPEALRPMAFLADHCWKGAFPDGRQTDEHCFQWVAGGQALRDVHTVRTPGKPDYIGDTTYFVDPATHQATFVYVENLGGVSRGTLHAESGVLVFPDGRYTDADGTMAYRARWTPQGDDAYEAFSEAQAGDGWKTMFRLVMRRQP